jgi:hypothetical protein
MHINTSTNHFTDSCPYAYLYILLLFPVHRAMIAVSIMLDYGLDNQDSGVRFLVGAGNFSLHHHIQNGSAAHPASYPMGPRGFFLRGKVARV